MNEKFAIVYYKPEHLWTGNKAIRKLHKETGLSKKDAKSWLAKQASPKSINHLHYKITKPNEMHQFEVLYVNVKRMNNAKTAMIGMKPKDAIKLSNVELVKSEEFADEKPLPENGLYRYFYQPGEQHGDQKRRATDFVWSKNIYRLDRRDQEPGNRILYYLQGGPERAFVREELMQVPETTEKPPDWVQGWK